MFNPTSQGEKFDPHGDYVRKWCPELAKLPDKWLHQPHAALDENLTHHKAEIPQLFWFNALLIASNGTDSRVGSLTADWEVLAHG